MVHAYYSLSDLRGDICIPLIRIDGVQKSWGMVITLLVLGLYAKVVAYDRVTNTLTSPRDNRLRHEDALG
jgi:hypothetical protein